MKAKYFTLDEFKCRCGKCKVKAPPQLLIEMLERVREHFNSPITITSGYRCVAHNDAVGGAGKSRHLTGTAVDIIVKDVNPLDVYNYCNEIWEGRYGLGRHKAFTHIDCRNGTGSRWDY